MGFAGSGRRETCPCKHPWQQTSSHSFEIHAARIHIFLAITLSRQGFIYKLDRHGPHFQGHEGPTSQTVLVLDDGQMLMSKPDQELIKGNKAYWTLDDDPIHRK